MSNTVKESPGDRPVGTGGILVVIAYVLGLMVVTFVSLVVLWPPLKAERKAEAQAVIEGTANPAPTPAPTPPFPVPDTRGEHERVWNGSCTDENAKVRAGVTPMKIPFVGNRCVYDEDRLFLIVLFAGALGGLVYGLRSLIWYVGNRRLKWSWAALYFLTPFVSAGVALIFYFVIRGGFFSPTSSVADTSPFGFAALGALIGMFTEEAINKLRKVAETVLTPKEQGKDHVGPEPVINSVTPDSGPLAGGKEVAVIGNNFQPGAVVTLGGASATVESVEAKLVRIKTPPHAAGLVDVTLTNPDRQSATAFKGYEYKDGAAPDAPRGGGGAKPPTIAAVNPAQGDATGGAAVTITGSNFNAGARVAFGAAESTHVEVIDASTIRAQAPPQQAGDAASVVDVTVTNPDNSRAVASVGFSYV